MRVFIILFVKVNFNPPMVRGENYMSVKAAKSYTIYRKEKAGNGNDG